MTLPVSDWLPILNQTNKYHIENGSITVHINNFKIAKIEVKKIENVESGL